MIYGHLYTEGVIRSDYPENIKAQIQSLPLDCDMVIHHISSPGGNVYAAWKAIPELMKIGKPIHSSVEGEASSIASWLMLAGATTVKATNPTTSLIHEPFYPEGIDQPLRVDDLDNAKTELEQIRMSMAEAYAKKSSKPVAYWLDKMKRNTRMTAQMLKNEGLIDEVVEPEPRRIAAQVIDEIKENLKDFKSEIMNLFGKKAIAAAPGAVDLPIKDGNGKVIQVQSDNGDLVNKPATIDGAPAEGSIPLADGRTLVCSQGVVKEVKEAGAMPQETEAQRLQKQLEAVQAQLNQAKATEEARVKAEEETKRIAAEQAKAAEAVKALEDAKLQIAALAAQVEKFEKTPIGDQGKPFEGTQTSKQPAAMNKEEKLNIMASRTFIADNLSWMEAHYPNGKYKDGTDFSSYRTGGPNAVSILETNLNYTWNGVLDTSILYKPTIGSPALSEIFTIDLGAADKKRYHIAPVMNKVIKPYTGCAQAPTGSSFDITSKAIQLKPFEMYEGWCKDDFTDQLTGLYNILAQEWLKTGTDSFDPAGTPVDRMIMQLLKDAMRRDIIRRVSFGDADSSSADWNQINGYWPNLIDQSGASNYCVYRYGAALGIGALAANAAQTYFEGIFNNSTNLLKNYAFDSGRGEFLVTRSVWENYYTTLTGAGAVTEQQFENLVKGITKLTFRGIPVIPIGIWDDQLADATNPLYNTTRHLISFTVKDNHILGVENMADMNKIDSWFEKKDNKRYYRSNFTMGFLGAIHCELTSIAY